MSRIGKQPIKIPQGIEVKIQDNFISVKGPKGELNASFDKIIAINKETDQIVVKPKEDADNAAALWGLTRALIANMVEGVASGFTKKLEINGVGYKANLQGKKLVLSLGFSHPIEYEAPEGIDFVVNKNVIEISGIDKQKVGKVAADIRNFKKPEPYKGKGIKYEDEIIRRKSGKKAIGGAK